LVCRQGMRRSGSRLHSRIAARRAATQGHTVAA
jgi:hypothetical protein